MENIKKISHSDQKEYKGIQVHRIFYACIFLLSLLILGSCKDDNTDEPSTFPTNGLLAFLNFEGNSQDLSGNGNHGTLLGNANAAGSLVVGNNDTDALRLPHTILNGKVDFTIASWIKINTFRNQSHEWVSGANSNEDNVLIIWYNETTNVWAIGVNDGRTDFNSDSRIEDGDWHHIAVIRSGSDASLYLDGVMHGGAVSVGSDALDIEPGGLIFGQDQDALGGEFHVDDSWAGEMDNLRIYNRVLSAMEIQSIADEAR